MSFAVFEKVFFLCSCFDETALAGKRGLEVAFIKQRIIAQAV